VDMGGAPQPDPVAFAWLSAYNWGPLEVTTLNSPKSMPPGQPHGCPAINLQVVPSFEAFGRFFDGANPFVFWAQAVQMAWLPWHAAFQVMLPPGSTLPLLGPLTTRSKEGSGGMK
jgi:hypothetical protein